MLDQLIGKASGPQRSPSLDKVALALSVGVAIFGAKIGEKTGEEVGSEPGYWIGMLLGAVIMPTIGLLLLVTVRRFSK
jgi:hypothetical protein